MPNEQLERKEAAQPLFSLLPHGALLLSVGFLGLSFVGIRAIMADEDAAASLGFLRYGIATLILLPFLWRRRIVMPPLKVVMMVALLGILGSMATEGSVIRWCATHRSHHRPSIHLRALRLLIRTQLI